MGPQLAAEDDGPAAFWGAVLSAIASACPAVGRRSLGAIAGSRVDFQTAVLSPLIDDLHGHRGELDLVLDDLHLVADADVHATLGWLVEHAPAGLRIAIATRHAPALALGRLRARGALTELRAADLRFGDEDAERFLNERLGLRLGADDVEALTRRTEGWPAGLYLAALSLRGVEHRSQFIAAFAGDDELIVDYLGPELLRGLDGPTRSFLLRTSILDSFCAPLCDAVAGTGRGAEAVLGELVRTNLFVVSLDRRRRWFRYGRMFAELLRAELAASEPDLVPELHRRAAAWFAGEGRVVDAIAHDLLAGDRETAALRIARWRPALLSSGDWAQAAAWLTQLPERELAIVPGFVVTKAWMAGMVGAREEVERLAAVARECDDGKALPDGSSSTESALALIGAAFPFGDAGAARRSALRAAALDPGDAGLPAVAHALGTTGYWAQARERDVRRDLERVVRLGADRPLEAAAAASALAHLAYLDLRAGNVARARGHVGRARRFASERGIEEHAQACAIRIASGWLQLADGRHEAAALELGRGLELARTLGEPLHVANALRLLAECREEVGDGDGAAMLLVQARAIVELQCPDPGVLRELVEATAARLGAAPGGRGRGASPDGVEPLSERELEVLRMLSGTLSLPAIASELFVAHNTIKTHTRAIYRKLGVAGRAEAVARARELRLV